MEKQLESFNMTDSTSPSLLQDITLEQINLESQSSSFTGLTMKEYEENLKKLTQDNFNLKLRIYFLEERLSKINGLVGKEDLIKQNVALEVKCETQSKELASKQELLYEAYQTFDKLQTKHKEQLEELGKEHEEEKTKLQARLDELELLVQNTEPDTHDECKRKILELETKLGDSEERVQNYEEELQEYQQTFNMKIATMEQELVVKNQRIDELVCELQECGQVLANNQQTVRQLQQIVTNQDHDNVLDKLEEKNRVIESLRSTLLSRDDEITVLSGKLAKEKAAAQSLQSKYESVSFQNTRLKEEVEVIQKRLRRSNEHISPHKQLSPRSSDDDSRSKHLLKIYEDRESENVKYTQELEEQIKELEEKLTNLSSVSQHYDKLQNDHQRACVALKNCIKRAKDDKVEKEKLKGVLAEKEERVKQLESLLNGTQCVRTSQCVETSQCVGASQDEDKGLFSNIKEYSKKILDCNCGIEEKMLKITELENEVQILKTRIENGSLSARDGLENELLTKETQIEKLNNELTKRTFYLQEIVNKELWNKNRDIEKLQQRITNINEKKDEEILSMKQQLNSREQQLMSMQGIIDNLGVVASLPPSLVQYSNYNCGDTKQLTNDSQLKLFINQLIEERNILKQQINELNNKPERDRDVVVELQNEVAKSENFKKEIMEVCSLLTVRLEELACFLDSLLTNKQLIDSSRREIMKQAVERSLELSKQVTLSFNNESCNISCEDLREKYKSLLSDSVSDISIYRDKMISEQTTTINKLRNQLKLLTEEIHQRDIELSLYQNEKKTYSPSCGLSLLNLSASELNIFEEVTQARKTVIKENDASESEAWSEPDRSVSLARIGYLEEVSGGGSARSVVKPLEYTSGSSEETLNETNRTPAKRTRSTESVVFRRLHSKLKVAEQTNETLKAEIKTLQLLTSAGEKGNDMKLLITKLKESAQELEEYRCTCRTLEVELSYATLQLQSAREESEKLLAHKEQEIKSLKQQIEDLTEEHETQLNKIIKEKEQAEKHVVEIQKELNKTEEVRTSVEKNMIEIEKKLAESVKNQKECSKNIQEVEEQVEKAKEMMDEAEKIKMEADRKSKDVQSFLDLMRKQVEEKIRDAERKVKKAETERCEMEKQKNELLKRLTEAEENKSEVELKVKEGKERIKCMEEKLEELKEAMDQCNEDLNKQIADIQRKADGRVAELEKRCEECEWTKKIEIERSVEMVRRELNAGFELQLKSTKEAAENVITAFKLESETQIAELRKRLHLIEKEKQELSQRLMKQIDSGRLEASEAELEVARLISEKINLEDEIKHLRDRERNHTDKEQQYRNAVQNLEEQLERILQNKSEMPLRLENMEHAATYLSNRVSVIQERKELNIFSSAMSPPTSPLELDFIFPEASTSDVDDACIWGVPPKRVYNNSSPDLGIESDQGRFSSLEVHNKNSDLKTIVALKPSEETEMKRLEMENNELRRRLNKTRTALDETLTQLTISNQRKKQIERAICKQLHKTHHILKKARSNFDHQELDSVE